MYSVDWMLKEASSTEGKFDVTLKVIGGKNLMEPTELIEEDTRVKHLDTSEYLSTHLTPSKLAHKMHLYHLK